MKTKILIIFVSGWLSLVPVFPSELNTAEAPFHRSAIAQIRPGAQCIPQSELSQGLATLRSLSGEELFKVRRSLLRNAKRSSECRTQVIQALMTAMEQPGKGNALGRVDDETYALWANGADLLGELKATEALDLLIANFGLTDGLTSTLGHYPALGPVITMGDLSIPKLQEVLSKEPEPFKRKFAVFCLGSIGGVRARNVLVKARPGETDPCVKKFISVSLEVFGNKTQPNHITGKENGRWYSYLYCT